MEEASKRRLVGAAVIILLLVVFVPMLFEEEVRNPVPEGTLEIPPRPDTDREVPPELAEPPEEPAPLPPELPPPALYEGMPLTEAATPPPESDPEPEAELPQSEPASLAEEAPAPEPPPPVRAPARAGDGVASWVIQVAALTELPRARGLEKELRDKGFPAFIEQAEVRGRTFFRVRVGPEADRKSVETMASSLRQKTGHEGTVMRYP
jgi:DedD protein